MSTRAILIMSLATITVFLAIISAADAVNAIDSEHSKVQSANPALVKDEIIIPMVNGTEMEWRHIILKGNNTQIGTALGKIAQKDYGVTFLNRYADSIYGKARQEYMARNYPIFRERMKGIAMAYGLPQDSASFDTTTLPYDTGSTACSMIYFPPEVTLSGHAITSRNVDWFLVPKDVHLNKTEKVTSNGTYTRNFLMEIYPDQGYSTIAISGGDLNSVLDGMNSEGLGISSLADEWMNPPLKMPVAGDRNSGIMSMQIPRLVLETCRTVEEAKMAFLTNKEFLPVFGVHYMVYDSQGNSAIIEWNKTDGNLYFTDGNSSKPDIMTNHPMFIFSKYALKDLPRRDNLNPYNHSYSTFNRYMTLYNITSSHQGKYSEEDAADAMEAVYANTVVEVEGVPIPLPIKTLWSVILDLTDRSVKVKSFLQTGPVDPKTNETNLIFSPYLIFKMNNSSL